jgi:hypothetical protein
LGDGRLVAATDAQRVVENFARLMESNILLVVGATGVVGVPLLVLIHELGHALAAVARTTGRVEVYVGREPAMANFRVGRVGVHLHPNLHGAARLGFCQHRQPGRRLDRVLIALAGPVASLVGGIVALLAASATSHFVQTAFLVLAALSFWITVACLVPMTYRKKGGLQAVDSDGRLILNALRAPRAEVPQAPQIQWFKIAAKPRDAD